MNLHVTDTVTDRSLSHCLKLFYTLLLVNELKYIRRTSQNHEADNYTATKPELETRTPETSLSKEPKT
jgi:hypothetical protein